MIKNNKNDKETRALIEYTDEDGEYVVTVLAIRNLTNEEKVWCDNNGDSRVIELEMLLRRNGTEWIKCERGVKDILPWEERDELTFRIDEDALNVLNVPPVPLFDVNVPPATATAPNATNATNATNIIDDGPNNSNNKSNDNGGGGEVPGLDQLPTTIRSIDDKLVAMINKR